MLGTKKREDMEYRHLGSSGLIVSVFGYGNWINSNSEEEVQLTIDSVKRCWELGVNFFDTAEVYGAGQAEIALGKALRALNVERKDYVVSTKIFWGGKGPNDRGVSRKHLIEGLNASLARLEMDYVDIVFAHRPDRQTPLEEVCRAFSDLIDQGKTFYWGTSDWEGDLIVRAIETCERLNLHKPVAEQPLYNMCRRDKFEVEFYRVFKDYGYGSTIWSPLAGGILTGKYNEGKIPEGSRFDKDKSIISIFDKYFNAENKERTTEMLHKLAALAAQLGYSQPQLALAWAIANKDVSVCLLGFSRIGQVDQNLKAIELYRKWDAEMEKKVEEIIQSDPGLNATELFQAMETRRDFHIRK